MVHYFQKNVIVSVSFSTASQPLASCCKRVRGWRCDDVVGHGVLRGRRRLVSDQNIDAPSYIDDRWLRANLDKVETGPPDFVASVREIRYKSQVF